MPDDQLREFARLSTQASLVAMSVSAVGYALASHGALWLGRIVMSRTSMRLLAATVVCFVLLAAYVAYGVAYVMLQAELEYRFTRLRQLCHLPGLLPKALPIVVFAAVWLLSAVRRRHVAAV